MKGKILKTDKEWMVEIQSDLHGYGIGWGDSKIYPLFITDENIWEGKEVEVEPIQYDSNFLPVIVKIKTTNRIYQTQDGSDMKFQNKKTAIQELIEHFEDFKKHSPNVKLTLDEIINLLKDKLEKEKEQIIDAFEQGIEFGFPTNGSNYFNKTYNQNK